MLFSLLFFLSLKKKKTINQTIKAKSSDFFPPASFAAWTWSFDFGSANQRFPLQTLNLNQEQRTSGLEVASLIWCQCGSGLALQAVGNFGGFLALRPLNLVLPPPNTLE